MGTRATVLAMGLIGAGAYVVTVNWDKISRALGMDEMGPEFGRAIALVKKDYHLDRFQTNQEMIRSRLGELEGEVVVEGWDADHKSGELYLVTYLYTLNGVQNVDVQLSNGLLKEQLDFFERLQESQYGVN